jgi:hypothetical protein
VLAGFNPLLLDLNLAAAQSGVHRAEHAASAMLWDAVVKERIVDDTNLVGQSCLPIAGKFRSCECPGLLKRFCPGQQVRREPPSRDIVSVEIDARPTICEADFVAAELGDGFVLADADGAAVVGPDE